LNSALTRRSVPAFTSRSRSTNSATCSSSIMLQQIMSGQVSQLDARTTCCHVQRSPSWTVPRAVALRHCLEPVLRVQRLAYAPPALPCAVAPPPGAQNACTATIRALHIQLVGVVECLQSFQACSTTNPHLLEVVSSRSCASLRSLKAAKEASTPDSIALHPPASTRCSASGSTLLSTAPAPPAPPPPPPPPSSLNL
jgi:hypothetical protein